MVKETSACTVCVHSKIENATITTSNSLMIAYKCHVQFETSLLFTDRDFNFISFYMILLLNVFLRLLNSFNAISNCLFTFYWQKYFFACGRWSNVFHCHFKSAEWAGTFVVCSLEVSLRIISLRRSFGLPVWNFGRPRVNSRSLRLLGSH